jgi:arylsulfatase A-like enzyme
MDRRTFLSLLGSGATVAQAAAPTRPNVVVILVDDMGFSDLGCFGSEIPTPNIDRLAARGVRLTHFYNTARCSPSRAALMTGLYPHQAGMGHLDGTIREDDPGYQGKLADDSVTIAEALKPAGYFTIMTGKWHLGHQRGTPPSERGFDRSLNHAAGGVYYGNQAGKSDVKLFLNGKGLPPQSKEFGENWYSTDLWTDFALRFIDEARADKKPFFLYQAHNAPHFPLMAAPEDIARFRGKYLAGWDALRQARHERQLQKGVVSATWKLSERPPDSPAWDTLSAEQKDRFDHLMAIYAATMFSMDRSVGALVSGLEKRGILDNTLILFMSDNGGNAESGPAGRMEGTSPGDAASTVFLGMNWATVANTPFRRYKHFTHEGGIATPLIAHWPAGIPAGQRGKISAQPGHLIDIMPTVLAAAGAGYPASIRNKSAIPLEGTSLLPAFSGKSVGRKAPIFFMHEGNRAIREEKWKLVAKYLGPWELYDMVADRTEQQDLSAKHPDVVKRLADAHDAWAARTHSQHWSGEPHTDWGQQPAAADGQNQKKKAGKKKAQ